MALTIKNLSLVNTVAFCVTLASFLLSTISYALRRSEFEKSTFATFTEYLAMLFIGPAAVMTLAGIIITTYQSPGIQLGKGFFFILGDMILLVIGTVYIIWKLVRYLFF